MDPDAPISGVSIELLDSSGTVVGTTLVILDSGDEPEATEARLRVGGDGVHLQVVF